MARAVGIDLGTTNSVVAVLTGGELFLDGVGADGRAPLALHFVGLETVGLGHLHPALGELAAGKAEGLSPNTSAGAPAPCRKK